MIQRSSFMVCFLLETHRQYVEERWQCVEEHWQHVEDPMHLNRLIYIWILDREEAVADILL